MIALLTLSCSSGETHNVKATVANASLSTPPPVPRQKAADLTIEQETSAVRAPVKLNLTIAFSSGSEQAFSLEVAREGSFLFQEQNSPVTRKINFFRIQQIVSGDSGFVARLTNGHSIQGRWVTGEPAFYPERTQRSLQPVIFVSPTSSYDRKIVIGLDKITSINFDWQITDSAAKETQPAEDAVSIALNTGQRLKARHGFITDYCGHWYSTSSHERMKLWHGSQNWQLQVIDDAGKGEPSLIACKSIAEIELTGAFSSKWPACRVARILMRDGSERKTNLYLTGESYGGICYATNARRRDLDSFVGEIEYGSFEVPLDSVSKIVFEATGAADGKKSNK
jgi:hypothetical protein